MPPRRRLGNTGIAARGAKPRPVCVLSQSRHAAALTLPTPGGRLRAMTAGTGGSDQGTQRSREQRRAAALRANLRKRKAQQRARHDSATRDSAARDSPLPDSAGSDSTDRDPGGSTADAPRAPEDGTA